jgi:hypothetical protein
MVSPISGVRAARFLMTWVETGIQTSRNNATANQSRFAEFPPENLPLTLLPITVISQNAV